MKKAFAFHEIQTVVDNKTVVTPARAVFEVNETQFDELVALGAARTATAEEIKRHEDGLAGKLAAGKKVEEIKPPHKFSEKEAEKVAEPVVKSPAKASETK